MGNQLPALEKLFDQWAQKHEQNLSTDGIYAMPHDPPYGGFVRDGVVNFDKWKTQKVRICFLMNEAGGYTDRETYPEGHDVANEWNEKGAFTKFMFKVAVWVQAINDAFIPPVTYVKKSITPIKDDLIRSVAIVNIKKSDGQIMPDYKTVNTFAHNDADEIRKELEIIKANIIICCGNMASLWGKLPQEGEENPLKYVFYRDELKRVSKFAYAWDKKLVFSLWTPAQFTGHLSSNTISYYAVREIVRAALKALNTKPTPAKAPAQTKTATPKNDSEAKNDAAVKTDEVKTAEVKTAEEIKPAAETAPAEAEPAKPARKTSAGRTQKKVAEEAPPAE